MILARILWTAASFYLLVLTLVYVLVLDAPGESGPARLEYILDHWLVYQHQFKAEFLIGMFLCISSLLFALQFRRAEFVVISVGQLLYALPFPIVLGLYPEAAVQTSMAFSQSAHLMVNSGLMISLAGFIGLHWNLRILPKWIHLTAFFLAVIGFSSFVLSFLGQLPYVQAQKAMLAVTFLYLINGVYGILIRKDYFNAGQV